jgi:hypothetical protein
MKSYKIMQFCSLASFIVIIFSLSIALCINRFSYIFALPSALIEAYTVNLFHFLIFGSFLLPLFHVLNVKLKQVVIKKYGYMSICSVLCFVASTLLFSKSVLLMDYHLGWWEVNSFANNVAWFYVSIGLFFASILLFIFSFRVRKLWI